MSSRCDLDQRQAAGVRASASACAAFTRDDLPMPRAPHSMALLAGCPAAKRSVLSSSRSRCRVHPLQQADLDPRHLRAPVQPRSCGCQTNASASASVPARRAAGPGGPAPRRSGRAGGAGSWRPMGALSLTGGRRKLWSAAIHRNPDTRCSSPPPTPRTSARTFAQYQPVPAHRAHLRRVLLPADPPAADRAEEAEDPAVALRRGDKVVTGGGLVGVVQRVKERQQRGGDRAGTQRPRHGGA